MARRFPISRIVAVSNSQSQREHILREARSRDLGNIQVITADMNGFDPGCRFDRVVSIEMFEHMSNWPSLLKRIRGWIAPGGLLFVHVFAHQTTPYRFDPANGSDWIAQHFFTGGVMPSRALMRQFPDLFSVEEEWWWNGTHYARTANDWLARHAQHAAEIRAIFARTYGKDAQLWQKRWRLFFLATAGLFGHSNGEEWGIAHYLLKPGVD
jgi:cyclopropane-fatty-acyl-phospholipid synthase